MTASDARPDHLADLGELILEHADELAMLETLDNGKPLRGRPRRRRAAGRRPVPLHGGLGHQDRGQHDPDLGAPDPGAYLAYTLREPVGVVGQIIPWNFPLLMAAWKLGPALAARLHRRAQARRADAAVGAAAGRADAMEAGLPDGVRQHRHRLRRDAGAALAAHADVDKVAFTGSTEVGKLIVQAAAGNLKKVTLELGGKSPNVVYADADIGGRDPGRGERDLLQPRPVLQRRLAAVSSRSGLRRGRRGRRRDRAVDQGRHRARPRAPRWAR